jgi:DNA-binding GntR family transcriptional regulator
MDTDLNAGATFTPNNWLCPFFYFDWEKNLPHDSLTFSFREQILYVSEYYQLRIMAIQHSYQRAAGKLRSQILKGTYPPGGRLPTERELCTQLGVSRITVRLALDLLEEEHLIVRRQGSGTYVSDHPQPVIPLEVDYAGSIQKHAPQVSRKLLCMSRQQATSAPAWAIPYLGRAPQDFLSACRLDTSQKTSFAWDHAVIPKEFSAHLTRKDLAMVDFVERWKALENLEIAEIVQHVSAVAADESDQKWLGLKEAVPVLQAIEVYYSPTGKVLGVFLSRYLPGRIELKTKFQWPKLDQKNRRK